MYSTQYGHWCAKRFMMCTIWSLVCEEIHDVHDMVIGVRRDS